MISVGIVGLGRQGMLHLMNCLKIEDVQVTSVADKSKKALRKAKSLGISNLYTDFNDLYSAHPKLDAVVISLPNFLHLKSVVPALEAGFNVFIEKPLARSTSECHQIIKTASKNDKKIMVGHNCRFYDASIKMDEMLRNGMIGDLEVVTAEEVINGPLSHPAVPRPVADWWFNPKKTGGGVLMDIGCHMIDLFRFFAGDAKVLYSYLGYKYGLAVEDSAIVILESITSNIKGIINVGWYERTVFPQFDFRLILHGDAGYISSKDLIPKNPYVHAAREGIKNVFRRILGRKITPLSYTYFYESYYREMCHFFNCVKNNSEPSVSAEDGLKTIEIIEESYRKAQKVSLNG